MLASDHKDGIKCTYRNSPGLTVHPNTVAVIACPPYARSETHYIAPVVEGQLCCIQAAKEVSVGYDVCLYSGVQELEVAQRMDAGDCE